MANDEVQLIVELVEAIPGARLSEPFSSHTIPARRGGGCYAEVLPFQPGVRSSRFCQGNSSLTSSLTASLGYLETTMRTRTSVEALRREVPQRIHISPGIDVLTLDASPAALTY